MPKWAGQTNPNTSNSNMMLSTTSSWGIRSSFQFLTVFLIVLVISVLYLAQNQDGSGPRSTSPPPEYPTTTTQTDGSRSRVAADDESGTSMEEQLQMMAIVPSPRCDVFSGKWVFDNKTYPLYKERECTFMSDQLACQKYGRQDLSYQFWRWQPHQCDLPRFVSLLIYFLSCLQNFRNIKQKEFYD